MVRHQRIVDVGQPAGEQLHRLHFGNNMMELNFHREEEEAGGHQQFLMGLKASALKNEELLDMFYDLIIENYDYVGNYLIFCFMMHMMFLLRLQTTSRWMSLKRCMSTLSWLYALLL